MKKIFAALMAVVICLGLAACAENTPPENTGESLKAPVRQAEPATVSQPIPAEEAAPAEEPELQTVWEVPGAARLSLLQEEYPAGTERVTLVVENTGDAEIGYGLNFSCEKLVDGQWVEAEYFDRAFFVDVLCLVEPHSVRTANLGMGILAQPLDEGTYRLTGSSIWIGQDEASDPWQLCFRVTADAQPEPDYALYIPGQPVSGAAEGIPVRIINTTGKDANVLFIPHLERKNEDGSWTEVPYKGRIGFCGTPDPLPAEGRDWGEDVTVLWGMLEEGQYRLHYNAGRESELEQTAYGEFTVCAPVMCAYPTAEQFLVRLELED